MKMPEASLVPNKRNALRDTFALDNTDPSVGSYFPRLY